MCWIGFVTTEVQQDPGKFLECYWHSVYDLTELFAAADKPAKVFVSVCIAISLHGLGIQRPWHKLTLSESFLSFDYHILRMIFSCINFCLFVIRAKLFYIVWRDCGWARLRLTRSRRHQLCQCIWWFFNGLTKSLWYHFIPIATCYFCNVLRPGSSLVAKYLAFLHA